jgi:hypothetical protein
MQPARAGESFHPLDREQVRRAAAQFLRNGMHWLIALETGFDLHKITVFGLQAKSVAQINALKVAARHNRLPQRIYMGVHGKEYKERRQRQNVNPHLIGVEENCIRFHGLGENPAKPSACVGQDPHLIPESLQDEHTPAYISPIGLLNLWQKEVAKYTIFRRRHVKYSLALAKMMYE